MKVHLSLISVQKGGLGIEAFGMSTKSGLRGAGWDRMLLLHKSTAMFDTQIGLK